MSCPPLRARTFGSDAESVLSGTPAFDRTAGSIPAMCKHVGEVDGAGENTYRLERTIPTA